MRAGGVLAAVVSASLEAYVELLHPVAGQGRLVPAFLVAGTVANRLPSFVL